MNAPSVPAAPAYRRLGNIQTLRFLAALWVVLYHLGPPIAGFSLTLLPAPVRELGFVGVDVFFVISGLIMAETTRSGYAGGWHGAAYFAVRRAGRVYAGWWPFFLWYLALSPLMHFWRPEVSLLGSFFLWPIDLTQYLLPVAWTLSYELYFYVSLACILCLGRRHAPQVLVLAAVLIAAANAHWWMQGLYAPENLVRAKSNPLLPFYMSPLVLEFIAGFLLSDYLHRRPAQRIWPWLLAGLAFLLAGAAYQFSGQLQESGMAGFFHVGERAVLFGGFAVCLVALSMICEQRGWAPLPALQKLGDGAYSLYLGHIALLIACAMVFNQLQPHLHWPGNVWALICLTWIVAMCWLNYRLVEYPLHVWVRRTTNRLFGRHAVRRSGAAGAEGG